jgi:serine/threonine protein kinase
LDEHDTVKLADFGSAFQLTIINSLTQYSSAPKQLAGTYLFMAPEILLDMKQP